MTTPNADASGTNGTNNGAAAGAAGGQGGAAGDGSVEDIQNWADVKKAFAKRDELKGQVTELRTLVEGIGQKLEQLGKTPPAGQPPAGQQQQGQPTGQQQQQGGEAPKPTGLEAQVSELATIVKGLATKEADGVKAQRRKTIEDTVIAAAKQDVRDLVRGELAMLALDGAIDLHAEDTAGQVDKALAKLRAKNPGHFAAASGSAPAPTGQQNPIPPNAQPHELTPEQLNRLSDEEFSKLRKASRTSGLAV